MTLRNYILTYFGNKFKRTFAPMYYFCIKKSPTSPVGLSSEYITLLKKYIMELLKRTHVSLAFWLSPLYHILFSISTML